jgi:hypothetical protein
MLEMKKKIPIENKLCPKCKPTKNGGIELIGMKKCPICGSEGI